jgi:hypothetical protein
MKAYEFPTRLTPAGSLALPEEIARQLPVDSEVRAIVLVPEASDEEAGTVWSEATARQLLAGYADTDSIYDDRTIRSSDTVQQPGGSAPVQACSVAGGPTLQ